jgi:dienelactone hydrolase
MRHRLLLELCLVLSLPAMAMAAPPDRTGEVEYIPAADESRVAERFRLPPHRFSFEQRSLETVSTRMLLSEVTFPSPVETPHTANNTVHCEYFRPAAEGRYPAVVMLHILGGDFDLSRLFCRQLASNGVAALFVKMPYYGPRRDPQSPARMVSLDPRETVRGMTQAVLDIRRATAWLATQAEVDAQRLGIAGISLGGITAALAAGAEPRLVRVALLLAGGDVAQISWEARETRRLRESWTAAGGTRESLTEILREVDPVTYAANVRGRRVLMLNARYDEVVPPAATESLWRALGKPEIVWMDAGHYSSMRFIFESLARVTRFFQAE